MAFFIVVPQGQLFTQHVGPTFPTRSAAMQYAEDQCNHWKRAAHYDVLRVESVGTTSTLDEALEQERVEG